MERWRVLDAERLQQLGQQQGESDANDEAGDNFCEIGEHQPGHLLTAAVPLVPGSGDLASSQQTDEDPSCAHRDVAELLEHKQHDPVDQVHKRRRADVGGVRLRQHHLLDGTAVVVKDEGEQAQDNDDADYEPANS